MGWGGGGVNSVNLGLGDTVLSSVLSGGSVSSIAKQNINNTQLISPHSQRYYHAFSVSV